jgi:DNA-binding PadR family transcriptional regulator
MSLPHALLTSLMERSCSGIDLARRFGKSIDYFWHASHQQIYRELGRMEQAGWIESCPAPDAGRTRKRDYRVLATGRSELLRWIAEPAPLADVRDAFLIKARAAAILDDCDLTVELQDQLVIHRARLAHYREIEARDFAAAKGRTRDSRIRHMILKKGILYEEGSIRWAEEMLAVLKETADDDVTIK